MACGREACLVGGMHGRGACMGGMHRRGGMRGRGMHGRGAGMAGGMHGWEGVHGRGCVHGRGHVWQGACMAWGMHGRGMCMARGMCMPQQILWYMVNERAVCILLECILVFIRSYTNMLMLQTLCIMGKLEWPKTCYHHRQLAFILQVGNG